MDKETQAKVQQLMKDEVANAVEIGRQLAYIRSKHPDIVLEAAKATQTSIDATLEHQVAMMKASNTLPPAMIEVLEKRQAVKEPLNLLATIWKLQTDICLLTEPQKRIFGIQSAMDTYLKDIGLNVVMPSHYRAYVEDFGTMTDSISLMRYFHSYYPKWLKIYYAIQDGSVVDEVSYHLWVAKGCPTKFRLSRLIERITRKMPPLVRECWHLDPENCIDVLAMGGQSA